MKSLEALETKLLHYTGKAIHDYHMIHPHDRVLVCLSGGKDSYTMLTLLEKLRLRAHQKFQLHVLTLDQGHPGWDDTYLKAWLHQHHFTFTILNQDTYRIVKEKIPEGNTYCGLCSRLRRGIIYRFASEHGFNKIALGHHRDDINQTLLMSILYNGQIRSMPPKLLSDDKRHIVIRPLAYCQEHDIQQFAHLKQFPIIPCNLCGSQENLARQRIKALIQQLALENPKIPSNILHAVGDVKLSQLMDRKLWDFKALEAQQTVSDLTQIEQIDGFDSEVHIDIKSLKRNTVPKESTNANIDC